MRKLMNIIISVCLATSFLVLSSSPALAYNASTPIDYVAFGDSVAAGVRGGVREPSSALGYTDALAAYLENSGVLSSFNETFCTSGMTAKTLAAKTAILNDKTSSEYNLLKNAEIATLTIGANDLLAPLYAYISTLKSASSADIPKVKELLTTVANQVYDGTTAPAIQSNIETILQNIINANSSIKIFVMGYYNPLPLVSSMVNVDLTTPLKDFNVYISNAVSNVAAKNTSASLTYVDTMTAISANNSDHLVLSDIHPTPSGYKAIACEFWKQLQPLIDNAVTAAPTKSTVLINGKSVAFEAYNINDNNYFKLRDIAMALSGTAKNFNVSWDSQKSTIVLRSATAYTSVGGEMATSASTFSVGTAKTASAVYLDGKALSLSAYPINGCNYVKLRDLAAAINFGVVYKESTGTINIDTSIGYTA